MVWSGLIVTTVAPFARKIPSTFIGSPFRPIMVRPRLLDSTPVDAFQRGPFDQAGRARRRWGLVAMFGRGLDVAQADGSIVYPR